MNQIDNVKLRNLVIGSFFIVAMLVLVTRPTYSISNKTNLHFFGFKVTANSKDFSQTCGNIIFVSSYTVQSSTYISQLVFFSDGFASKETIVISD